MKKIIYRLIFAVIPALPVWIILENLWVGVFTAFLTYVIIHFFQFSFRVKVMAMYDYFSQHFVSSESGTPYNAETLMRDVEADPEYNKRFLKVFKKNI